MNVSRLWRHIKKRLRRKKSWLTLAVLFVTVIAILGIADNRSNQDAVQVWDPGASNLEESVYDVWLENQYVCGEDRQSLGQMSAVQVEQFAAEHPDWQLTRSGSEIRFVQQIDDLSPYCKSNAYFGVDQGGHLSLFDGRPEEDKVLQTFFQLNVEYLESSLPSETVKQLYAGIKVNDFAEYNSVLSTFSDYAVEDAEKVLKPAL
ncbi:hypothetical protein XYCOK13_29770 [Xylanibacillus composti]|uniref:Bypass of forespore C C-terminal domain-containing protein n=1 Tax=Xylanibacillus composti TaxID=1572762 RepID=A0A8J4H390_9BACL|nr:BofC C-terminal domain-containing protein [Xylanibacillus composti]GIQ70153.1 hypothetical protein XYCOK13_29770 [Xylanibacillus composti]